MAKKYVAQVALQRPPESNWLCPTSFPDLRGRGAKRFGIDIESKDPRLTTDGPGWMRGDAKVIGVAIAVDGWKRYYPCGHDAPGHQQVARNVLSQWLKDQMSGQEPKIGANIVYDLLGLRVDLGVPVYGPIVDIQVVEALLDEESLEGYSLDVLGEKYVGKPKDETMLLEACAAFGLGKLTKGVRKKYKDKMYLLPPKYVGPYAEEDAALPLEIFDKQYPLMVGDELLRVWDIESRVTAILPHMHMHGVRIDTDRAEQVAKILTRDLERKQQRLNYLLGFNCNVNAPGDLQRMFDEAKQYYPFTKAGNPSFTKDFLGEASETFPAAAMVTQIRKIEKTVRDFVVGTVLEKNVKGRIHATFNQTRQDESGARSGRFSCTNPNLQQITARDPFYGPLVRSLFVPELGEQWASIDVSQQEMRWTVSFGYLLKYEGAAAARQKYIDDPKTDFHTMVAELTGLARKVAKEISLGLSYGMGISKLAIKMTAALRRVVTEEEAKGYVDTYHARMPFVKKLNWYASSLAQERGYVKTVLGRRRHFNLFEPAWKNKGEYFKPLPLEKARVEYSGVKLKRALVHKAYNSVDQGTSADQIKVAFVRCWDEGILIPLLIHDEGNLSFSDPRRPLRVKHHLINALPCTVPMSCDVEVGPNWGEAVNKPTWSKEDPWKYQLPAAA